MEEDPIPSSDAPNASVRRGDASNSRRLRGTAATSPPTPFAQPPDVPFCHRVMEAPPCDLALPTEMRRLATSSPGPTLEHFYWPLTTPGCARMVFEGYVPSTPHRRHAEGMGTLLPHVEAPVKPCQSRTHYPQ
ncbi:uncharacterized protein LOC129792468 [Lutzomyia longipalpis]|uniref:uncharacterized protein LOC129792468 n=1 Tax=Lutzomyia longipalpis TaxID=7200 RepID=UPI0024834C2E|nr:uncharacterized protein LOC129792460 isoform X2 [Lutzomyia longipalpis]XP_055687515.1 uncharacterized protein LOC129792468 [Lutzomyia longipalpis]